MGFWGSFVVCRHDGELDDLDAVFDRVGPSEDEWDAGGWRFGRYSGSVLFNDVPEVLVELGELTAAPVLMAFVLDSDAVVIDASSPTTGWWRACLARAAMRRYAVEAGQDFDADFLGVDAACEHTSAWAVEAGLQPDVDAIGALYRREHRGGHLAEADLFQLWAAMGLPEA